MPKLSQTKYPTISFITPTLNASAYLEKCLVSITKLKYPKSKIEIIIADGGSTDDTISIAKKYKAKIYHNKFKTSESGKAVCLRQANGEFVVLVDSDNIITDRNWLIKMIKPLILDEELVGSEPIRYTYRKYDGYIDRYCALMGMNDPLCFWLGAYDRVNTITGKWTGLNVSTIKRKGYLELRLRCGNIPTIGANGKQISVHIKNGKIIEKDLYIHFPIPMQNAWDNVIYTCSTMLLFENESQIDLWCKKHRIPKGDIQPIEKIWEFSKVWYGNHLNPEWKKWTSEEAAAIFKQFNLTNEIWNIPVSDTRF